MAHPGVDTTILSRCASQGEGWWPVRGNAHLRDRLDGNKALVDLAARLDAFNVVELKVCQNWMARNKVETADLPAFLDPVTNGPEEVTRMQLEGYASF